MPSNEYCENRSTTCWGAAGVAVGAALVMPIL
jgi:hypothetical protein